MAKLLNRMLNLVGWETEEEEELDELQAEAAEETFQTPNYLQSFAKRTQQSKVVNIHSNSQFKVVIMQPETFDDARDVCDHLKNKKPVIVNLENLTKETAQRVVDFLSGSVYAVDGDIQKVSTGIFMIAPSNVEVMGDFKDELKSKGVFPWVR
ncbi:MAG: cell division protein SepF [Clostridiaceae bacterium]|nr:cell division protein SepF [Clostridiaceae bacterium]